MTRFCCSNCGTGLTGDEIALHRKLVSRVAKTYFCLDCQAQYCSTTRDKLEKLIEYYHKTGICSLFAKYE